jgi:hypothetical protein
MQPYYENKKRITCVLGVEIMWRSVEGGGVGTTKIIKLR